MSGNPYRGPSSTPPAAPGGGSSNQSCPSGYHLDPSSGQCIQNCKADQHNFQGECVRDCPPGMTLNDEKVCIRPIFNRSVPVTDVQHVTVIAGGYATDNTNRLLIGAQSSLDKDIAFKNQDLKGRPLSLVNITKLSGPTQENESLVLIGESTSENIEQPTSAPIEVAEIFTNATSKDPFNDTKARILSGVPTTIGSNSSLNAQIQNTLDTFSAAGGAPFSITDGIVTGPTVKFESNTSDTGISAIPKSVAKVYANTNTSRYQIKTDANSAQSNTIFLGQLDITNTKDSFTMTFPDGPAYTADDNVDLILSGGHGIERRGVNIGLQAIGRAYNYETQDPIDSAQNQQFEFSTAITARTFTDGNNQLTWPGGQVPREVARPIVNYKITINDGDAGFKRVDEQANVNKGYLVVGQARLSQRSGVAFMQASAYQPDIQTEDDKLFNQNALSTNLPTDLQDPESIASCVFPTHILRFERPLAFQANGNAQSPSGGLPSDVRNSVYLIGRAFNYQNKLPQNLQNQSTTTVPTLAYIQEHGQAAGPVNQNTNTMATGASNSIPQLWAITGDLTTTALPTTEASKVECTAIASSTHNMVGDMYYNSAVDTFAVSFADGIIASDTGIQNLIDNGTSLVSSFSKLEQKLIRFNYTGDIQKLVIPANCVNVHVILWGAGGSAEDGVGGSGSYVEGDLIPNEDPTWWNVGRESTLYLLVGGGGNADSSYLNGSGSFGGGGVGQFSGLGQGGGRTSILSKVVSSTRYQLVDRVVAGGGGGSTGGGLGGNAGHFTVSDLTQSSVGEAGSPSRNGGQGGQVTLAKTITFQTKAMGNAGRGGIVQGQAQNTSAQSGGLSYGGNSQNFPAGLSAVGTGGGGGGYFGGGAGAYLGNSLSNDDLPSGGGGGSSQAPIHSLRNLVSTKGSGILGPQASALGSALIADNQSVATGGSGLRNQGGHGYAAVILTIQKGVPKVNAASTSQYPLQYSLGGFDPRVLGPFDQTDSSTDLNNAHRCRAAKFTGVPSAPLTAVYISSNLIIACEFGDLQNDSTTSPKKGVWAATLNPGGSGFASLDNAGSFNFKGFANVQAIRDVNGQETSSNSTNNNTTTLAFLGNGIRIVKIQIINNQIVWNVQNVTSTINDLSFDNQIIFNDGNQNGTNGGQFIACGYPQAVSMSIALQCSMLPLFNGGYPANDVVNYFLGQSSGEYITDASPTQPTTLKSYTWPTTFLMNRDTFWPPKSPSEMSNQVQMYGGIQDNAIKQAIVNDVAQSNDLSNIVISIGGYIMQTSDAVTDTTNFQNLQPKVLPGTQYAFVLDLTNGLLKSSIQDFSASATIDYDTILSRGKPLVRSPSTILISTDAGQSFTFATSEYVSRKIPNASNLKGPLSEYICLPMDLPHIYNDDDVPTSQVVFSNYSNPTSAGQNSTDNCQFYQANPSSSRSQSLTSRFQDVTFLSDSSKTNGSGYFVIAGCFVQDLNLCHFLGGQLPIANPSTETVPSNSTSGIQNGILMNNLLWMIHTDDILSSINSGNKKYIFKARPMFTTGSNENFYSCYKLATATNLTDSTGSLIENQLQLTTDIGLYAISQSAINKAYKADYVDSHGKFNKNASIEAVVKADDTRCTKDTCASCQKNEGKVTFTVGENQPPQSLCAKRQDSAAAENGPNGQPIFVDKPDSDVDLQHYYEMLDIQTDGAMQTTVGPNVYEQETSTEIEGAFLGRLLQGPYSGPDDFNAGIQLGASSNQKSPSAPVDPTTGTNANNIDNATGSTGPVSYRKRNPVTGQDNIQQQQPFLMDPFLGLPCSQQDTNLIQPWDSFVNTRMQQKGLQNVQLGILPSTSTDTNNRLWMGYVDACRSDYNGYLWNGQYSSTAENLTGTFLPKYTPLTYTQAFFNDRGNAAPVTSPFNKVGNPTGNPPFYDLANTTLSNLQLGAQNLQPLTDSILNKSEAPENSFAAAFSNALIGAITPANQGVQEMSSQINQTREDGIVPPIERQSNLFTFVASLNGGNTDIRSFRDLMQLDLTHFFTNIQNTNSQDGNYSANLGQTLALTTSTTSNDIALTNFWNQQASRLLVAMGKSTAVTLQINSSPAIDQATAYSAQQLMVTTNFFRGRNWSFQWPGNLTSTTIPPTPTFGNYAFFCDQPSQVFQNALTEWFSPDPFMMHYALPNSQSPVNVNATSEILSQGNVFNYVFGLTQVNFTAQSPTFTWTNASNATETQVPIREPNLILPSSIRFSQLQSIPVPDRSVFKPNDVAVWLAEDHQTLANQNISSNSPIYGSCHGVYFSNLRQYTGSGTSLHGDPAQFYTVQMDVFVNCTLMSRLDQDNYFFHFNPENKPDWYKTLSTQGELPGNFDPFFSVVFLDAMSTKEGESKGDGYSLGDLAVYLAAETRNNQCSIVQNSVPYQNQVLLVDQKLPRDSTGLYPTFATTSATNIPVQGPQNFQNKCTVNTSTTVPTAFTYPDGTQVTTANVTTAVQFVRFSQTVQLPVAEILDTYFKARAGNVNPVVWTVPLDAYPTNGSSKSGAVVANQFIQFQSINVSNADITLPKAPPNANPNEGAIFPMLGLNQGVDIDTLKNQTSADTTKNLQYKLASNRNLARSPNGVGQNDLADFRNNSPAIETQVTKFDIYYQDNYQDNDTNSVGINATQKFQDTALAREKFFHAQLCQSQPQNPFQVRLQNASLAKPFCVGPPSDYNLDIGASFPEQSIQLKLKDNQWLPMNVQHINPFMNVGTYIQSNLMVSLPNNNNYRKNYVRFGGVGQTRMTGQRPDESQFEVSLGQQFKYETVSIDGFYDTLRIPWTFLPMDCDNELNGIWQTLRPQALPNNFIIIQAQQGLAFDPTNPLASANAQPPFSLFAGFDVISGGSTRFQRQFADLLPYGLTPAPYLVENNLQSQNDSSFMRPLELDSSQGLGSRKNPFLFLTNRYKDVYHNGMNGSTQSNLSDGANGSQLPSCASSGGFFYVNQNPTWNYYHITPPQQSPYNTSSMPIWFQSYLFNSSNQNRWISKNNLPQTQIQLMHLHNDKIYIRVTKSSWLNFPNWAVKIPSYSFFTGNTPQTLDVSNTASSSYFFTPQLGPIKEYAQPLTTIPKTYDPLQVQGRDVNADADIQYFNGGSHNSDHFFVLTNRNQNDLPSTVFQQNFANGQEPPVFGWVMTQFFEQDYGRGNGVDSQFTPTQDDMVNFMGTNAIKQYAGAAGYSDVLAQTYPTSGTAQAGAANKNFMFTSKFFATIVNSSLVQNGTVNQAAFPNVPSFGAQYNPKFVLTGVDGNFNTPTTVFPKPNDPGASNITFTMPTSSSQAFRFDCGSVFAYTANITDPTVQQRNDPRQSPFCTSNGTTGISVQVDVTYGNVICFTQTALRELEAKGSNDPNLAYVPPLSSFDSWPGGTDIGCVVQNDTSSKNGFTVDSWNTQLNESWKGANPSGDQYSTSRPTLPMAILNVATKGQFPQNFGFQNPNTTNAIYGQGAQGTQQNDDPYVICCYFSLFPDFTSNRFGEDLKVYATSDQVDSTIPQTDTPLAVNESSDMDVSQVQPSTTYVLDVQAPSTLVGALGSSQALFTKKISTINGIQTVTNNTLTLANGSPVAPLSCIVRSSQGDNQQWSTPSPQKPQLVPDQSGLALSLWAYSKAIASPVVFPDWTWTSSNDSNQVIGALTATTPEAKQFFETNNVPQFWKSSAFVKQAMGFSPLTVAVYGLQSGQGDAAQLNDVNLLVPIGTQHTQSADPGPKNTYQIAKPQGPLTQLEKDWNTGVSNSQQENFTRPGGLQCTPLRAFQFSLGNLQDTSVFSIATNRFLNSQNRFLLGCSNGTIRVLDVANNNTLYATAPGNFVTLTNNTLARGGQTSSFVNVNNIQAMQQFAETWFVATDMGLFQTPIDPTIPILRNNTADNINFFVAPNLVFVYIRPQENLDASQKQGATTEEIKEIGGNTFPPCTNLKEVFFRDKSQLLVSYPDQAQGFFTRFNQKTVFTPLDSLGPSTQDQPQNGGLGFGPQWQAEGDGNVACSFQLVQDNVPNSGLKRFKQCVKFTGLPTVGALWSIGKDTNDPYTLTTTNTVQKAPLQINSHMTDIVLRQTYSIQSCLQIPFRKTPDVPDINPPNIWLFAPAVGKSAGFLSSVNEVLCPIPNENSFVKNEALGIGDVPTAIKVKNLKTPVPLQLLKADSTATKNIQGDMTIRVCQNAKVSVTQTPTIVLDDDTSVTTFLNNFFTEMEESLSNAVDPYVVATSDYAQVDPMSQYSLLGQVYTNLTWNATDKSSSLKKGPLSLIQLRQEQVQGTSYGLGPFAVAIGVISNAITNLTGIIDTGIPTTQVQPMFVAGVETDPLMQAYWGFAADSLLKQGLLLGSQKNPPSTIMPLAPDFQSVDTLPSPFTSKQETWTTDFNFFAVRRPNQFNSAIFQWSPGVPTKDNTVRFKPKEQVPGSGLNETSITITSSTEVPPLFETLFEDILVQRANLLSPNDTIGDFAFADLAQGILTWTLGGPYNVSPIQMSRPTILNSDLSVSPGLDTLGRIIRPVQDTEEQISKLEFTTDANGNTVPVTYRRPPFGLPVIHSNSLMAYNPQTQEFFCAGQGSFVDDEIQMNDQVLQKQQPNGVLSQNFKNFAKGTVRFMICQNPGSRGSPFAEDSYVTGVPSRATDLLPSTLNWLQIAIELPQSPTNGSSSKKQVTLLSEAYAGLFTNADQVVTQPGPARVNCFAFSPNTTAMGGFYASIVPSFSSTSLTKTTAIWQRQNNTWQQGSLLVQGEVTAMDQVGQGWQIAVWNDSIPNPTSSMYFASANFTVIVLMDTWGPDQNALKITSLQHIQGKSLSPCDPAQNLVPNPNNPNTCLKKCPSNFEAFDDFCALICPEDLGYRITEFPNECKPPKYKSKQVAPHNNLLKRSVAKQNGKQPESSFLGENPQTEQAFWKTLLIVIPIIIVILQISFLQFQFNRKFI